MKEKERYEYYLGTNSIKDNTTNQIYDYVVDLLNQQSKRLKEFEQENQQLKQQLAESEKKNFELVAKLNLKEHKPAFCILADRDCKALGQVEELQKQLHDLPKKIVGEIRDCLLDCSNGWWRYFMTDGCEYMLSSDLQGCLDEIINTILKKYGWEDESK